MSGLAALHRRQSRRVGLIEQLHVLCGRNISMRPRVGHSAETLSIPRSRAKTSSKHIHSSIAPRKLQREAWTGAEQVRGSGDTRGQPPLLGAEGKASRVRQAMATDLLRRLWSSWKRPAVKPKRIQMIRCPEIEISRNWTPDCRSSFQIPRAGSLCHQ